MVVEIICGIMFGSMALLADGLHMASHTAALGIAAFAYSYARRNAANQSLVLVRQSQFAGRFNWSHLIVRVRSFDGLGKRGTILESGWNRIQFSNLCSHNRVAGKQCQRIPFEHRR